MITKVCSYCKNKVEKPKRYLNKSICFCNTTCSAKYRGEKRRDPSKTATFTCEQCQTIFERLICFTKNKAHLFCCRKCCQVWASGNRKHSEETKLKLSVFWSGKRTGKDNPLWRGGVSRGYKSGYYSTEYKKWRKGVFNRDSYRCQECGSGGYLEAHHIKSFAFHPDLRYELSNGLTLCRDCHKKTPNYNARARLIGAEV